MIKKMELHVPDHIRNSVRESYEKGLSHHPKSVELMEFLAEFDWKYAGDVFMWRFGGDGDNGEELLCHLDVFFEMKSVKNK